MEWSQIYKNLLQTKKKLYNSLADAYDEALNAYKKYGVDSKEYRKCIQKVRKMEADLKALQESEGDKVKLTETQLTEKAIKTIENFLNHKGKTAVKLKEDIEIDEETLKKGCTQTQAKYIDMYFNKGMTQREIAKKGEVTPQTVSNQIRKGLQSILDQISPL